VYISINSWKTSRIFQRYSGGFWLYNRNYSANIWENTKFSAGPYWFPNAEFYIDTLAERGLLKKVNRIQIIRVQDSDGKIIQDSLYHIGFGVSPNIPQVFLDVDSLDLLGPEGILVPGDGTTDPESGEHIHNFAIGSEHDWVPRERYEKKVNVQILLNNNVVLYQDAGLRISGNSSVYLTNKTLAAVARKEYGFNGKGPKRFVTDIYENGIQEYKWLKFGSTRNFCGPIGANELGISLENGLQLGEVPFRFINEWINGSYWNMGYMKDKVNQYTMGTLWNVDPDSITYGKPGKGAVFPRAGIPDSVLSYIQDNFGFIVNPLNSDEILQVVSPDEGTYFPRLVELCKQVIQIDHSTNRPPAEVGQFIDLQQFFKLLSFYAFIGDDDVIVNNLDLGITPNGKIFPMASDFDKIAGVQTNYWNWMNYKRLDLTVIGSIISLIYESDSLKTELMRIHQDLLNTQFLQSKTDSLVQARKSEQDPYFEEFFESWNGVPNSGCYSSVDHAFSDIQRFFTGRNDEAFLQMTNYFQPDSSYTSDDKNLITLNFNQVAGDTAVWIQINSLKENQNWSGNYFPTPTIRVTVPAGYYIVEFPDSTGTFELYLIGDQTLTIGYSSPLPVELVSFTCSNTENGTLLQWKTASEFNSDYFTIERSGDGINFDSIGRVNAAGNSNVPTQYAFIDSNSGYYRLKMVDIDGTFEISVVSDCHQTITGSMQKLSEPLIVYPNPVDDILNIQGLSDAQDVQITIVSMLGQTSPSTS
jgi:hypothetical protein